MKLTGIYIDATRVTGDIIHLRSLANLTEIDIQESIIIGDMDAFHEYRESAGLKDCCIYY
tara:strand:- start:382 stop:561 length:180 start_codon:yes stop_codon:yes gene_type:complete